MIKVKCVRSSYTVFQAGEVYEFNPVGQSGRFTVYQYTDDFGVYTFGLDDALSVEVDGNYMQFAEV